MAKQNTNLICPLIIHMILELTTTTKKSSKVFTCPWHFNKEWCIKKLSKLNTFFVQPTNHIGICWFFFCALVSSKFKQCINSILYIHHLGKLHRCELKLDSNLEIFFQDDSKKNPGLFQIEESHCIIVYFFKGILSTILHPHIF